MLSTEISEVRARGVAYRQTQLKGDDAGEKKPEVENAKGRSRE
jgi:hypothetical protein